jgi:predicted ATPase
LALIRRLSPKNFLSFGPDNEGIELRPLNLLIGPNGSGKSNLIEAVSLLRSAPKELRDVTRKGGGVSEWIWKGNAREPASLEWDVNYPKNKLPLRHFVAFRGATQAFSLDDERIEESKPRFDGEQDVYFYYRYQNGHPVVNTAGTRQRSLSPESIEFTRYCGGEWRSVRAI